METFAGFPLHVTLSLPHEHVATQSIAPPESTAESFEKTGLPASRRREGESALR